MSDLIKALQIFLKYDNPQWPTHCEHDVMYVCIDPAVVSAEDKVALEALGFEPDEEGGDCFHSFHFGSA